MFFVYGTQGSTGQKYFINSIKTAKDSVSNFTNCAVPIANNNSNFLYLVAGRTLLTKMNIASAGGKLIRFLMTYMNWATAREILKLLYVQGSLIPRQKISERKW